MARLAPVKPGEEARKKGGSIMKEKVPSRQRGRLGHWRPLLNEDLVIRMYFVKR